MPPSFTPSAAPRSTETQSAQSACPSSIKDFSILRHSHDRPLSGHACPAKQLRISVAWARDCSVPEWEASTWRCRRSWPAAPRFSTRASRTADGCHATFSSYFARHATSSALRCKRNEINGVSGDSLTTWTRELGHIWWINAHLNAKFYATRSVGLKLSKSPWPEIEFDDIFMVCVCT